MNQRAINRQKDRQRDRQTEKERKKSEVREKDASHLTSSVNCKTILVKAITLQAITRGLDFRCNIPHYNSNISTNENDNQ